MDEKLQMSEFGDGTPEPEAGASTSGTQKPTAARACDYCRQRKAGCSREKPQCRNCKNAKRQCTYSDPVLRKENPTVKISGQLSTLGSRLSRIESLLPSLNQTSLSTESSTTLGDSNATLERLSNIEKRIEGFDAKLDSMHLLLANLTRFANKAAKAADAAGGPIPNPAVQRRSSATESDIMGHDGLEDYLAPVGESLLCDDKGNTQYHGRSSNYSFTADAEMLVQSRLRGMKDISLVAKDSEVDTNALPPNGPDEQGVADWQDKEVIDDEGGANPVCGMALHMGDMHMRVDDANSRKRSACIDVVPGPSALGDSNSRLLDEAAELAGVGGTKYGGDGDYYIPTEAETHILLDRIYTNPDLGAPVFRNIPPAGLMGRLLESPSKFLAETEYNASWVTIAYCLAHHSLGSGLNEEDVVQRRKKLVLKRAMARNAWASFKDLKLYLTPRIEHVVALMTLSTLAQDTSRPGLCWMLTCQACRLAQAMGLHRRVDSNSHGLTLADIELRKYLFWALYILDKSFSLFFGRTSCFQDYDCDMEALKLSETSLSSDMGLKDVMACFQAEYFRVVVEVSKLQSAVYKKLYSARASNTKGRSRCWMKETEKWVWELDSRLRTWKEGPVSNLKPQAYTTLIPKTNRWHEDIIVSLEILEHAYHTLMTMIHRRLYRPASGEYDDGEVVSGPNTRKRSRNILLHSARSAIHVIQKLGKHKNSSKTKWPILFHPFAPFFVLFSKIVTSPSSPTNDLDIELMHHVGNFLQDVHAETHIPGDSTLQTGELYEEDGANKFLTVIQAFIRVAKCFMKRDKERMIKAEAERQMREMRDRAQELKLQGMMETDFPQLHNNDEVHEVSEAAPHIPPTGQSSDTHNPPSPNLHRISPPQQHPPAQAQLQQQQQQHQHQFPISMQQEPVQYPFEYTPFLQQQTALPQTTVSYDYGQGDFVHWNNIAAAQPVMSINHLQDLASMDVDMNMGVEALYEEIPGYPEVFDTNPPGRSGQFGVPSNGIGDYGSMAYTQRAQGGPGVGNNYMEMFEMAVKQGAMDFDWINWDA